MTQAQRNIRRKLKVLEYAKECGNIAKACRYFGISRQCYYNWLHAFEREGEAGLVESRPFPENHKLRTPKPIEDKIVHLRLTYHFGPQRIASPNLNGKVERSHLTDKLEFYQLLDYTDDVDLRKKLVVWEELDNVYRPHGGLGGKTPYEVLREKMVS